MEKIKFTIRIFITAEDDGKGGCVGGYFVLEGEISAIGLILLPNSTIYLFDHKSDGSLPPARLKSITTDEFNTICELSFWDYLCPTEDGTRPFQVVVEKVKGLLTKSSDDPEDIKFILI